MIRAIDHLAPAFGLLLLMHWTLWPEYGSGWIAGIAVAVLLLWSQSYKTRMK